MSHVSDSLGGDRALYCENWSIKADNSSGGNKNIMYKSLYVSMDGQSVRDSSAKRDSRREARFLLLAFRAPVYRASQAALLTDL